MPMEASNLTRGQKTRQAILTAAHHLFIEQGYHGTSMRQIAHRAGVAFGGIYNHFPGKEAIFSTVFDAYHPYHEILPALQASPADSVEGFVRGAADRMLAALQHRPGFLNLVFIELVEFEGQHLPQLQQAMLPQLERILEQLPQATTNLRPIPVLILFRSFVGMFFAYALTEMILGSQSSGESDTRDLDLMVDIYLHGVLKPP